MPSAPHAALEDLLSLLFEPDELRRFLRRQGGPLSALVETLPGDSVSKAAVTHDAAKKLVGQGLADAPFFAALKTSYEGRKADIEAVETTIIAAACRPSSARAPRPAPASASLPAPAPGCAPRPDGRPWNPVRVLHLSDLHFDERAAWDAGAVLDRLAKEVAKLRAEIGVDLVVLTGDIANQGKAVEYEAAWRWLSGPLAQAAGMGTDRIRLVPGNHDVDRGLIDDTATMVTEGLLNHKDPQQTLAALLGNPKRRALLLERKTAWLDFVQRFHPGLDTPWWSETLSLRGWSVHLAGFDSALLSGSDQDARSLMLSRWQCNQVLAGAEEADLSVALLHHPWDYLAEEDRAICEEEIGRRCGVILRGHLHQQQSRQIANPDRGVLELAAGASYSGSRWANAFQLLELDPGSGQGRVHFRVWDGHDWMPDRNRYQAAPTGVATLALRQSPRPIAEDATVEGNLPEPGPQDGGPLADYARQLRDRADILAQVFRSPGGPSTLSKVYVEMRLSSTANALDAARAPGGFFGTARGWLGTWLASSEDVCRHSVPQGPFKLESVTGIAGARWAVLGDPGGGKTTLLRHTALEMLAQKKHLPMLLKVSELQGDLGASVARVYGEAAAELARMALRQGRATLLLDGMDEATDREAAQAAVLRAATEAGACPLILASRPIGWQRPSAQFVELALCPLGQDGQRQLLEAWVAEPARVTRALDRLDTSARLRRLAENPLLLTLVALLLREGEDIPERRGQLYEKAVQILLTRAADPQRAQRRLREPDLALQALAFAALKLHGRSEEVYRTSDLLDALLASDRHRINLREIWGGPGAFLAEVAETTGLLVPTTSVAENAPAFAFPHRTFREHLAAVALERDMAVHGVGEIPVEVLQNAARKRGMMALPAATGELGRVLAEAQTRPERWSEVLALVCALVGRGTADALVRRVAADGSPELVQRVVAEAEGISSDTVLAVLGCERGWDRWRDRQTIIEEIPNLVGNEAVAVRLLDRLRRETTDGNDLFWIRETLNSLADSRGVDPDAARDARQTVARIFDHVPVENLEKVRALMQPWWRVVPPIDAPLGPYLVGSNEYQIEKPVHKVTLTAHFRMLAVTVTWELYCLFDPGHGAARSSFNGRFPTHLQDQVPVYNITWYAATVFAAWVGARLPLEPEWECVCRAGHATHRWMGDREEALDRVGWYRGNSGGYPHPVGQKPANPWGLHDMHSNVWEWCLDWYNGADYEGGAAGLTVDPVRATYAIGKHPPKPSESAARGDLRALRGGSWLNLPDRARSASRLEKHPSHAGDNVGFRLVLTAPVSKP